MWELVAVSVAGFAMATLGVALLVLGEVPFLAGKRIPGGRARWIGLVLVSFLPLAWGTYLALQRFAGPDSVQGPVVIGIWFGVVWLLVFILLFRVMVPKRLPRKVNQGVEASAEIPFAPALLDATPAEEKLPTKKAAAQKKTATTKSKPAADDNPFQFN